MVADRKTKSEIEAHYGPLVAAARREAEARRDAAWLAVPLAICGVPVCPMSLAAYLALRLARNPHVCADVEPAETEDMASFWARHDGNFLWRISLEYRPDPKARTAWIAAWSIHRLPLATLHMEIGEYLRSTFADRPRPVETEGDERKVPITISASFAACWIHDFGAAYGWSDEHTLALPLVRIFQLRHLLQLDAAIRAGEKPLPVGDEADELAAAAFAEIAALS